MMLKSTVYVFGGELESVMKKPLDDGTYSKTEAQERFERTLKAALSTPPKPLKSLTRKKPIRQARKKGR